MLDFDWFEDQALHMINIPFILEQKTALEARHTKARDKRECDRIKAVLLRSEGWPVAKIAQALRKKVKPALLGISVITPSVLSSSHSAVALPVI